MNDCAGTAQGTSRGGYGLNLIDYNRRQTTLAVGVSFFD
jgi:outer membrane phospholipase A